MYLFLPEPEDEEFEIDGKFTFQNVSISTSSRMKTAYVFKEFTFQNVSISTVTEVEYKCSTAIYIPKCIYFYSYKKPGRTVKQKFTFQNVSISTFFLIVKDEGLFFIYIPKCIYFYQGCRGRSIIGYPAFTFQNVSISTLLRTVQRRRLE